MKIIQNNTKKQQHENNTVPAAFPQHGPKPIRQELHTDMNQTITVNNTDCQSHKDLPLIHNDLKDFFCTKAAKTLPQGQYKVIEKG